MKAVRNVIVLLLVSALAPMVALATADDERAYLDQCRKESGVPVPVAVVAPSVGPEHNGSVVMLEFVVDQSGKPVDLAVKSSPDDRLAATVLDAVKQWRFKPVMVDGVAVETKVSLPVRIVDGPVTYESFASR